MIHPYLGKIPNLTNIFQRGWNHQLAGCLGYLGEYTTQLCWDYNLPL